MSDVAKAAGVARVTVSRVLSEPDSVAPATRAAVQAAVAKLGYVPNLNAGALASSRSRIVGAIVPTLSNAWFADTIEGLTHILRGAGYQLLLGQTGYDAQSEEALVDAFLGRRVDAMVLTGTRHNAGVRAKLRKVGVPTIECWDLSEDPIDMAVGFSNQAVGGAAAAHLIQRGNRRLGFIGADEDRSHKRLRGFRSAAALAGVGEVAVQLVVPPSSVGDGAAGLAQLLAAEPALEAVFCGNDTLALGALAECRRRGLRVPTDLAVVGFSDLPVAAVCVPTLTTVRIDSRMLGERAGHLLVQRLERSTVRLDRLHDIGFSLAIRESA